jgi:hypothetical protein
MMQSTLSLTAMPLWGVRNIPAVLVDRKISCYIRSLFLYVLEKESRVNI